MLKSGNSRVDLIRGPVSRNTHGSHESGAPAGSVYYHTVGYWEALLQCRPLVVLFIIALILPVTTSFSVGSLRLTVYRAFLLAAFVPCLFSLLSGRNRIIPADWLVAGGALWAALSLAQNHGLGISMESGGIFVLESFGTYMLGRFLIRGEKEYRALVALLVALVFALLPLMALEALTNKNFFGLTPSGIDMRLGLHRARGPFEHPIIGGVFLTSVLGISWFCFPQNERPIGASRLIRGGGIWAATVTSVSSGPLMALVVQLFLIIWNYLTATIRHRWRVLAGLIGLAYVVVDLLSNRKPIHVFLSYLTFSSHTAYNRLIIWEWGFYENVLKHPLFGIGMNDWVRPNWMVSSSMDNFWLVLMVRHGLPCFLMTAGATLYLLIAGARRAESGGLVTLQKGWAVTIIGLILASCTVHLWNALFVYFFFLLGSGGWFCRQIAGDRH